jgi:hypothetical protein
MESVPLDKGYVHLMEDRVIVENDNVKARKRKNVLVNSMFVTLFFVYGYYSYQQYQDSPHEFKTTRTLFRMLFFLFAILPGIINNVIRFSTADDIPYSDIKKHERHGTLLKWNSAIRLYLPDNKIRTLWADEEEMKRFRFLLDQKLMSYRPSL